MKTTEVVHKTASVRYLVSFNKDIVRENGVPNIKFGAYFDNDELSEGQVLHLKNGGTHTGFEISGSNSWGQYEYTADDVDSITEIKETITKMEFKTL